MICVHVEAGKSLRDVMGHSMLKLGKYKHYKGKDYEVVAVAKLEATLEDMVVYRPLYQSEYSLWVRPLSVFIENVEVDGKIMPRFEYIGK